MKKLVLVMPLIAMSLLASCGSKPSPTPEEDVTFSTTSIITLDETKTKANISLDWTPTDHLIECSDFSFALTNQSSIASTIVPGSSGSRPLSLTITFDSALSADDKGDLKFHYNDKTAKKEGEGIVENINIKVAGEKPSFSVTASTIKYDEGTHSAVVELNWEPTSDSIAFSNLDFTYGTKHADEVIAEVATSSPANIYIKFGEAGLDEDVIGTLSFAYSDTTTGVTGEDEIKNITIDVDEPEPPVIGYSISMKTEGTTISPTTMDVGEPYIGTITVTNDSKILYGDESLKSVKFKTSGVDITSYCTDYDPSDDYKSATFTIPTEYITDDIEVEVTLTDEPEPPVTGTWTLALDGASKGFGDLKFKDQTADSVTIDEYIGMKSAITMTFIPKTDYKTTQFTITADNEDVTVGDYSPADTASFTIQKADGFADGDVITLSFAEPTPPVTEYSISMKTEGTDIMDKELPTDKDYVGTITVTANKKILNGLTSVILEDSNTDITNYCTYTPEADNKSASLKIPLFYLTNDIEVAVNLVDDPTPQITYTVSFDSKGGLPAPAAQTINAGDPASIPSSPFKDDFSFGGWYTDEDATEYKYDFARPVISDLTLYARWNKIENLVTVTFDAGNGIFANGEHTFPIKVDKNSELNLCLNIIHSYGDPTLTDNIFAYYTYKDLNKAIGYNDIVPNDVTIVANYFLSKNVPYKNLNGISWDVIKNVAVTNTEDHIKDLFDIGATKDIYFDYSGTKVKHTVQLLNFRCDHLHYDEGERTTLSPKFAGITFDFSTLISDKSGNAITTEWDKSSNRDFEGSTLNTLLNKGSDCIFNRLPGDLKGIIEEVDQKVAHGSDYAVEPRYTTKLYPLAYSEMVNESAEGAAAEGAIYRFYKDGGASVRKKKDTNNNNSIYWLRSPCTESDYLGNFDYAWAINTLGDAGSSFKYDTLYAFAPAFCI